MVFPKKELPDLQKGWKFLSICSRFTNIYSSHIVMQNSYAPIPMCAVS